MLHSIVMWHWLLNKENELTLQQAEMRMIRCKCGIKVTARFLCSELTDYE